MERILEDEKLQVIIHPPKDPADAYDINISTMLQYISENYVRNTNTNFNVAALVIQNCCYLYVKKVEYIHLKATNLCHLLLKEKSDEKTQKDPKTRERHQRINKYASPLFSTDIKPGKNLSCLRQKKTVSKEKTSKKKGSTAAKKPAKQKYLTIPVMLIPLESDEKGDEFSDTDGQVVGCKNDYMLNKSLVVSSGWLLMPTTDPTRIPTENSPADYTVFESSFLDDSDDEGVDDMGPPIGSQQSSQPGASQPMSDDDGIGLSQPSSEDDIGLSQPSSDVGALSDGPPDSQPDMGDDFPMNDPPDPQDDIDPPASPGPNRSRRASMQSNADNAPASGSLLDEPMTIDPEDAVTAFRRPIEKKSTTSLPRQLKGEQTKDSKEKLSKRPLKPIADVCARTFFTPGEKDLESLKTKNLLDVEAYRIYPKYAGLALALSTFRTNMQRKQKMDPGVAVDHGDEDDDVIVADFDDIEQMQDDSQDTSHALPVDPLNDADVVIDNDIENRISAAHPIAASDHMDDFPHDDSASGGEDELQNALMKPLKKYISSDTSPSIREWDKTLQEFFDELDKHERFDIHDYGSRMIDALKEYGAPNMSFTHFVRDMEKWEVHRYFMALLPLANMKNVEITTKTNSKNEEEIFFTLLNDKMHHNKLDEFNQNPQ